MEARIRLRRNQAAVWIGHGLFTILTLTPLVKSHEEGASKGEELLLKNSITRASFAKSTWKTWVC